MATGDYGVCICIRVGCSSSCFTYAHGHAPIQQNRNRSGYSGHFVRMYKQWDFRSADDLSYVIAKHSISIGQTVMGMCFLNDIFTNGQLIYTNTALVQNSRPSELWKCRCVSAGGLTVSRTTVSECFFIIIFHVSALSAILLHTQLLVNCVVLRFLTK